LIEAVEMGCRGFVADHASLEETASAITTVARGEAYIPSLMLGSLLRHIVKRHRAIDAIPHIDALTNREREVFDLARLGSSRADIADRLFISPGTVRSHLQSIYKKMRVHSQAELIALASGAPHERD
jgi:DNA-binding NarL/FixJ family response regulator